MALRDFETLYILSSYNLSLNANGELDEIDRRALVRHRSIWPSNFDGYAYFTLLGAATEYGIVHALGSGHGKYLVGGVGLGTSVSVRKLVGLAAASSLTQSLWAIALVFGGSLFIEVSALQRTIWLRLAISLLRAWAYCLCGVGYVP